jgi:hypothetical protein
VIAAALLLLFPAEPVLPPVVLTDACRFTSGGRLSTFAEFAFFRDHLDFVRKRRAMRWPPTADWDAYTQEVAWCKRAWDLLDDAFIPEKAEAEKLKCLRQLRELIGAGVLRRRDARPAALPGAPGGIDGGVPAAGRGGAAATRPPAPPAHAHGEGRLMRALRWTGIAAAAAVLWAALFMLAFQGGRQLCRLMLARGWM